MQEIDDGVSEFGSKASERHCVRTSDGKRLDEIKRDFIAVRARNIRQE